jgi:anti-sigma B factor antagonist
MEGMVGTSQLGINEHKIAGAPAIRLSGRLDYATSPTLRKIALKYASLEGQCVVVDLTGVDYADTSGLATLLEAQARLRKSGGRMILFGLGPQVRDLFTMNQVDRVLTIVADEAAAVQLVR